MAASDKLTPRQTIFVAEYCIDMNATRAMIAAGYSAKYAGTNADKLLKLTKVANAIAAMVKTRVDDALVTRDDVIRGLHTEATATGAGTSHSARVAAWTALGKTHQLFTDKVEHTGANGEALFPHIEVTYV